MPFQLRVRLSAHQLQAAARLHERLAFWQAADAALVDLSVRMPSFDLGACLLKASAINQLYGTNVLALARMAEHIAEIVKAPPPSEDIVEVLAALSTNGKVRRHVSFASKFAHFFIDSERYPIFDSYAFEMLRFHLFGVPGANPPPYAAYVAAHAALIELCDLGCSGRELDRYLWLAGLYRSFLRKPNAEINAEVSSLFARRDAEPSIASDLADLEVVV